MTTATRTDKTKPRSLWRRLIPKKSFRQSDSTELLSPTDKLAASYSYDEQPTTKKAIKIQRQLISDETYEPIMNNSHCHRVKFLDECDRISPPSCTGSRIHVINQINTYSAAQNANNYIQSHIDIATNLEPSSPNHCIPTTLSNSALSIRNIENVYETDSCEHLLMLEVKDNEEMDETHRNTNVDVILKDDATQQADAGGTSQRNLPCDSKNPIDPSLTLPVVNSDQNHFSDSDCFSSPSRNRSIDRDRSDIGLDIRPTETTGSSAPCPVSSPIHYRLTKLTKGL